MRAVLWVVGLALSVVGLRCAVGTGDHRQLVDGMSDAIGLLCMLVPLTMAGVALLWLLYGFRELRLLFMRWLDRR